MASRRRAQNVVTSPLVSVSGGHYFGLTCVACRERFAVLDDATRDENPIKIVGGGYLHVMCPYCDAERLYPMADLKWFRQS